MSTTTGHEATLPQPAHQWRTLWLASLGGALEFYDFVIFVFFVW